MDITTELAILDLAIKLDENMSSKSHALEFSCLEYPS